jgi:hypothetical protein
MASNFSKGRVLHGVAVVFEGDVWVEEPSARGRQVPWKAGFFSAQILSTIPGDCRLELGDGRTGTMTCTKAQPGMTGGSNVQFEGIGPLVGVGEKPPETLPERLEFRATRVERELYEQAAERDGMALAVWMRDRLTKAARGERAG